MGQPTPQRLRDRLHYDPITGALTWKVARPGRSIGSAAGTLNTNGYRQISVDGVFYVAHRIAWAIHYGKWPDLQIDHINGDRDDNRIANLRLAAAWQNVANQPLRASNTSGFKGAYRVGGRWMSKIVVNKQTIHIGRFDTAEQAHAAYCKTAKEVLGRFYNSGGK